MDTLAQALWDDAGLGAYESQARMTYSDMSKLLKKHRSLAVDLADRLEKFGFKLKFEDFFPA